jgi:hypothetical protein
MRGSWFRFAMLGDCKLLKGSSDWRVPSLKRSLKHLKPLKLAYIHLSR